MTSEVGLKVFARMFCGKLNEEVFTPNFKVSSFRFHVVNDKPYFSVTT